MCKDITENVEVYFICYKKEDMELVESYYDEILDTHYWYFNAYLAYKEWKTDFKNTEVGELTEMLLTIAASRYLIYRIETQDYKSDKEHQEILKDMENIEPELKKIMEENKLLSDL